MKLTKKNRLLNRTGGHVSLGGGGSEVGGGGSGGHASDPAMLLDALGGESLPEKERRLSEKIVELQKLRQQLFCHQQHDDYRKDKVNE